MKKKNDIVAKSKNEEINSPKVNYRNSDLCPVCNHPHFTWGYTTYPQRFSKSRFVVFWGRGEKIKTRQCRRCGNIQMFAKVIN